MAFIEVLSVRSWHAISLANSSASRICTTAARISMASAMACALTCLEYCAVSEPIPESDVELGIKNKIKNMLELGLHPNTPDFETQEALENAQRLLQKYNLEQLEVMGAASEDSRSSLTGGMRVVEICPKGNVKKRLMEAWMDNLIHVMKSGSDCEAYYETATASHPMRVVFYGVRQNANCAGYAFSAAFNRINVMAAAYGPVSDSTMKPKSASDFGAATRAARANYRNGIAIGLDKALRRKQAKSQALTNHSKKVAEEFEKAHNLEWLPDLKWKWYTKWNAEAYEQGKKDWQQARLCLMWVS